MSNANDQRILELKKQIEAKKSKLNKSLKFVPITNCSIEVDGIRYNINATQKDGLITLAIKLNSYLMSAKELELDKEYLISGYKLEDWIADIKSRINILSRKDEEQSLKAMEEKLDRLLSDEKKKELELDDIESMLK